MVPPQPARAFLNAQDSFATELNEHVEYVTAQVKASSHSIQQMSTTLKRLAQAERDYAKKIQQILQDDNKQGMLQSLGLEKSSYIDQMVSCVEAWEGFLSLYEQKSKHHRQVSDNISSELINPLNDFSERTDQHIKTWIQKANYHREQVEQKSAACNRAYFQAQTSVTQAQNSLEKEKKLGGKVGLQEKKKVKTPTNQPKYLGAIKYFGAAVQKQAQAGMRQVFSPEYIRLLGLLRVF